MNLKFCPFLITISVTDQNISDLITTLVSLSIDKENSIIEISKRQINHAELLQRKQLINGDV